MRNVDPEAPGGGATRLHHIHDLRLEGIPTANPGVTFHDAAIGRLDPVVVPLAGQVSAFNEPILYYTERRFAIVEPVELVRAYAAKKVDDEYAVAGTGARGFVFRSDAY